MDDTKRFARDQETSNVGILLFDLATACTDQLKWELYGQGHKHGISTFFTDDRKERAQEILLTAMALFQELELSKEDVLLAWDAALKYQEELIEIAARYDSPEGQGATTATP